MNPRILWVPFSALNAPSYSVNTKLISMLLRSAGSSSSLTDQRLRQLSGLDLKTIARARARLSQEPLPSCCARPNRSCAAIPEALLTSTNLSAGARLLYGQLQSVPDFENPSGSFTYASLCRLTGRSDDTLRRAVAELVTTGWLAITQANRKSPLRFTLRNPVSVRLRARIARIRRRVRGAQHRGEALLREFLNTRIALDDYEENASPDFLINPYTGELMELDRYYPASAVAVEFNGAQHDDLTDLATFEATVKQVGRDAMKAFLCKERGIDLVILRPEDLSLKGIDQKIPAHLPRRDLEGIEPLVAALEEMASEYRGRTAEEMARSARGNR